MMRRKNGSGVMLALSLFMILIKSSSLISGNPENFASASTHASICFTDMFGSRCTSGSFSILPASASCIVREMALVSGPRFPFRAFAVSLIGMLVFLNHSQAAGFFACFSNFSFSAAKSFLSYANCFFSIDFQQRLQSHGSTRRPQVIGTSGSIPYLR